jgi:hypothetical protein
VLRYYERRREVLTATPRDADPARLYEQLALAALPDFAHWVAVVDPSSRNAAFSRCTGDHEHSFDVCRHEWAGGLDLDTAMDNVVTSGFSLAWNDDGQGPRGMVSLLNVEDSPVGVVVLARDQNAAAWSEDDLGAIHDVVTALGVDLERLRLRYESRLALRASQRVASQLHQVISASLAVGTLSDENSIAQNLARSARSVFDVDRASVTLGDETERVIALAPARTLATPTGRLDGGIERSSGATTCRGRIVGPRGLALRPRPRQSTFLARSRRGAPCAGCALQRRGPRAGDVARPIGRDLT